MTAVLETPDVAALSRLSGVELTLGSGTIDARLDVHGVPVFLALGLSVVDGTMEIDVAKASAEGLGIFGEVRHLANLQMIASAAALAPRIVLAYNERGNLTLSVAGIVFESVSVDEAALTVIADVTRARG